MTASTTDWSGLASRTLDTLLQRRAQVDARTADAEAGDRRRREDSALERFTVATVAIDEAWTEGARRVEELEREAERIRDEVRSRTDRLECEQAIAVLDLLRVRPAEDVAVLLGVPFEYVVELARAAEDAERAVPTPREAAEPAATGG
jgi:hypothetical protein